MIIINILIPIIALTLLIWSSVHDHVHKESYYYAGGTYLCKEDNP